MRVRVYYPAGQKTLEVEPEWSTLDLKRAIAKLTEVPSERQTLMSGYPRRQIIAKDGEGVSDYLHQGDAIYVEENKSGEPTTAPPSHRTTGATTSIRPSDASNSIADQGEFVVREVPDDNSCLFRSVAHAVGSTPGVRYLRETVAREVRANVDFYSEAVLGRPNAAYAEWITRENSWGGAIELGILAKKYELEICAFDVMTVRMDAYGEGNGFRQRVFLIYDGLHYNYLALKIGQLDITRFDVDDETVVLKARELARAAHAAKSYTDTKNFMVKCDACSARLKGEEDAIRHANATGHGSFSEA